MASLSAWANFYIIVGSSAGALIGLLFVVITLITGRRMPGARWGLATFNTPTVVHLGAVLFVTASLSAPWSTLVPVALLLGVASLGGMGYAALVVRRLRRGPGYQPGIEDWLGYAIVPLVAYTALFVAALLLTRQPEPALFGIGAAQLLLLFTGIHNAWDLATYAVIVPVTSTQHNEEDVPSVGDTD